MGDYFDLDQELAAETAALSFNTADALPFVAPVFWTLNGSVKETQGTPQYFGGWSVGRVSMDELLVKENRKPISGLVSWDTTSREGKALALYTTRSLVVAPVAFRRSWVSKDVSQTRMSSFQRGYRQHVQVIAIVGLKKADPKAGFTPWGPVILSSKGYQAKYLQKAFTQWEEHIAALRVVLAKNVPAWLFWASIGTFGKERVQEMVGTGNNTSPITPIGPYLAPINEPTLKMLYGGEELARLIVDYRRQATAWSHAWDTAPEEKLGPAQDFEQAAVGTPAEEADIPF